MSQGYQVPAQEIEEVIEVKKSRFIARVARINDREEAMAFVSQARDDFPDARHYCWAYLLGNPHSTANAAMNDDGEPSGTAGKPIFNVIQHKGIGDVIVVVTRYFGGIKLGAGGLVRAYSGAAEAALSRLQLVEKSHRVDKLLRLDFPLEQPLRHWLSSHDGQIENADYAEQVSVLVSIAQSEVAALEAWCRAQGVLLPDQ